MAELVLQVGVVDPAPSAGVVDPSLPVGCAPHHLIRMAQHFLGFSVQGDPESLSPSVD